MREQPHNSDISAFSFGLDFGTALEHLKDGRRLARDGWNGKDMFVYLVPPASYAVRTAAAKEHYGEGSMVPYNAYFAIKNVDGTVSTWVPSVNDCLSDDWFVVGLNSSPAVAALADADAAADLAGTPDQVWVRLEAGAPIGVWNNPNSPSAVAGTEVVRYIRADA